MTPHPEPDTARVEWLLLHRAEITRHLLATGSWVYRCWIDGYCLGEGRDHRDAIDVARVTEIGP